MTVSPRSFATPLRPATAAEFIFAVPPGAVRALAGIPPSLLRLVLNETEPSADARRVLFTPLSPSHTAEALVDALAAFLADMALRLWPTWFTDVSFAGYRDDTLGRLGADAILDRAVEEVPGVLRQWARLAVRRTLTGRSPRLAGVPLATELAQLALAISRTGLVLVVDASQAVIHGEALVRALEWAAQASCIPIVALFQELPPSTPPFDRLLYGAQVVAVDDENAIPLDNDPATTALDSEPWLAPVRGMPHPMSDIEQRLARMLDADAELSSLFYFNHSVETKRGSRYCVDLVWPEGRLAVELDGYDHAVRRKFIDDRHRDYELTLTGFTVLRLANDEILQDFGRAVEKIRDIVRLCRLRARMEG